jgi:chemotaxis protein histidine kinase CheA
VVVVFVGNRRVGLVVDSLIGQEEVVIKPLGSICTVCPDSPVPPSPATAALP